MRLRPASSRDGSRPRLFLLAVCLQRASCDCAAVAARSRVGSGDWSNGARAPHCFPTTAAKRRLAKDAAGDEGANENGGGVAAAESTGTASRSGSERQCRAARGATRSERI